MLFQCIFVRIRLGDHVRCM